MYSSATIRTIARYRTYAQSDANDPAYVAMLDIGTLHGLTITARMPSGSFGAPQMRAVAMMAARYAAAAGSHADPYARAEVTA